MAENDSSPDAELQFKKQARRRLVGASALVLFAVIALPMVMDREPRPPAQDIQVRIPSQDAASFAPPKAVPAKGKLSSPSALAAEARTEAKPEAKQESKPDSKPDAKPAAAAPVASTTKPAASKVPETKPGEKKPEARPAAPATAAPAVTAASDKKSAPDTKTADKKSATESAKAADALSGEASAWVVQLGAYKDAANVRLMQSKLKELKLPVFTEKFDSPQGPRIRVRAGPFSSREAAEKANARIKIIGVTGTVAPK